MSDQIIPAIVFRLEKFIPLDDVKALMTDIKIRCRSWTGTGEYQAVVSFVIDSLSDARWNTEIGATVPYDPDSMDEVLLAIPELTSVKRYHQLDLIDGRERKNKGTTGFVKLKPKPDPENMWRGWDKTKVASGLRHMCTPEGLDEADRFADLLKDYPFTDKTPRENQTFIEMDVIAILEDQYPNINAVDVYLQGAVVRELRVIADPENQPKLGDSVRSFRCQFGNHPSTFVTLSKSATHHLAAERKKAAGTVAAKFKPEGIAARYSELMLDQEMDYITAISAGTNDAVHRDDLSDAAKEKLKKKQSVNPPAFSA